MRDAFSFLPALVLGVVTAVGGGSLQDVLSGRTPKVFERGEPYAVVAAFASIVFLVSGQAERERDALHVCRTRRRFPLPRTGAAH